MDTNIYGPVLPPGFKKGSEDPCSLSIRPNLPDKNIISKTVEIIGPQLPPKLASKKASDREETCEVSESVSSSVIGPALPPGFIYSNATDIAESDRKESNEASQSISSNVIGPALPPGFALRSTANDADTDSDSDSVYGPLPAENSSESVDGVIARIEKRAIVMRKKLQGNDVPVDNKPKREEWMTLPATDYKNQFGAISRCLVGDSQVKPPNKRPALDDGHSSSKDEQLKKELEKYNKAKRSESLLELHKKKKKQKKDKESTKDRKPFDRDAELGLRLMDQRQVNSVLRNAKKLNSRFASGASQYL